MNDCLQCGKETDNPKFCSNGCSATFNNKGVRRHGNPQIKECLNCGKSFKVGKSATGKYCCLKCSHEYRKAKTINEWLEDPEKFSDQRIKSTVIRDFILNEQGGICDICGIEPFWNGKPLKFVLDHHDGCSWNNYRDNLRLICHNCDSQTDTYKGKNVGNGRHSRRERYKEGKSY